MEEITANVTCGRAFFGGLEELEFEFHSDRIRERQTHADRHNKRQTDRDGHKRTE